MKLEVIILAAGKGTRMKSNTPKVLHQLGGKPLLTHVINTTQKLKVQKVHIVYGKDTSDLPKIFQKNKINWIKQPEQLGTADAVKHALNKVAVNRKILILYADVPLIKSETLQKLVTTVKKNEIAILTATLENPASYGRIFRDAEKNIVEIVEAKDASTEKLAIKEINSGIYCLPAKLLKKYLPKIKPHNAQKEYYLTDLIKLAHLDKVKILSVEPDTTFEIHGINDRSELAALERVYQKQIAEKLMQAGVTICDPNRFDARGNLKIAADVTIDINAVLNEVTLAANCYVGPNTILENVVAGKNTKIGANCVLRKVIIKDGVTVRENCVIENATLENECIVGPFSRIRPGTKISKNARVGNFVEIKNSTLGEKSKAPHLSYLGDSIIGKEVNIGAGTITCNYDGAYKHQTIIENGAFIGSNCQLVAPVKIGENATIGAGSTITENAPANKLTVARAKQVTVPGWKRPTKNTKAS
jgi:bifunctional UDP-N-acetylglucosamine pyrophosphorylase / glucosamine-1-phosphate N-acetyltransferase